MHFEYTQYVRGCLVVPFLVSIFMFSMLVSALTHFAKVIINHKFCARDGISLALVVLITGFFLCMNIGRLLHGGIHLIYERETNAVELQGKIIEIKELGRYSFPELKTEYGYGETNGVQFLVDGVKCTAVEKGMFSIGDSVTIIYLPRSGYILSIYKTD